MKAKAKTATAAKAKAKIDLKAVTVPKMKFVQPKPAPAKGKAKTAPPTVTAALIASVETDKTKVANGNRKGFSPPFVPDLSEVRAAAAAKATAKRQKLHGDVFER